jgi:hypothetical protein
LADENELAEWPVEQIPDGDDLLMGVHRRWFKADRSIQPGAFRNHNGGMSTDWSRYSAPEQTRQRRRTPLDNAVIRMNVGDVRAIPGQSVQHTPDWETMNRAHSDVVGEKDEQVRILLRRAAEVVLPLPR